MTAPAWHARFFAKVALTEGGCHLWTGSTDPCGYGRFNLGGVNRQAHRVALIIATGEPAPAMEALHECDAPACVNPKHLHWGTHAENMADMAAKGRASDKSGERNGRAKVTSEQAAAIRDSTEAAAIVAARHGLHWATVYRIRRRQLWESAL